MKFILEHNAAMSFVQHRDHMRGLPFYGNKGDFNFVAGKSQFTPGVSIKLQNLKDLSRNADKPISKFAAYISRLKEFFKPGDQVRGTVINTQFDESLDPEDGDRVIGRFHRMEVDHGKEEIRMFMKNGETLEEYEVYPDTMERLYESFHYTEATLKHVKPFDDFSI